jgi:predicted 2-oxoglutarate/Fe(II)-dependent dioxygenase YbiX
MEHARMPTLTNNVPAETLSQPALGPLVLDSQHLRPYVLVLENVLSPAFCAQLIDEFAHSDEWQLARVGSKGEVNRDVRHVDVVDLSDRNTLNKNPRVREGIEQTLFAATFKTLRHYQNLFPFCRIVEGQPFELLRYPTGAFYRTHTDSFKKVPRSLSCSFTLNDDFLGGEWSFFGRQYTLRPPLGSVLMFPSNFMFPHEIMPVTGGTRYAVVTWLI